MPKIMHYPKRLTGVRPAIPGLSLFRKITIECIGKVYCMQERRGLQCLLHYVSHAGLARPGTRGPSSGFFPLSDYPRTVLILNKHL